MLTDGEKVLGIGYVIDVAPFEYAARLAMPTLSSQMPVSPGLRVTCETQNDHCVAVIVPFGTAPE